MAESQIEQAAFDYTMLQAGLDHDELTPERERLVRRSGIYQRRLLYLHLLVLGRTIRDSLPTPIRRHLTRWPDGPCDG